MARDWDAWGRAVAQVNAAYGKVTRLAADACFADDEPTRAVRRARMALAAAELRSAKMALDELTA